jgi:hypothetical protein
MQRDYIPWLAVVLLVAWHHAPVSSEAAATGNLLVILLIGALVCLVGGMLLLALIEYWRDRNPWAVWFLTLAGTIVLNQRFANLGGSYGGFLVFFDVFMLWLLLEWLPPFQPLASQRKSRRFHVIGISVASLSTKMSSRVSNMFIKSLRTFT